MPRRARASAHATPPMPPPTMRISWLASLLKGGASSSEPPGEPGHHLALGERVALDLHDASPAAEKGAARVHERDVAAALKLHGERLAQRDHVADAQVQGEAQRRAEVGPGIEMGRAEAADHVHALADIVDEVRAAHVVVGDAQPDVVRARSEEFRWLMKISHCVLGSMAKSAATANDGPSVRSQVLPVVSSVNPPLKR